MSQNEISVNATVPPPELTLADEIPNTQTKDDIIGDSTVSHAGPEPEAVEPVIQKRGQWDSPIEFLLCCIAMSVGLGNIWRFPVTLSKNGGGAFIIAYLFVVFLIGRPIFFLELCLGQFTSCSQIKCWKISPFFKGIGYATCLATMAVLSYYCSLMALAVFYFGASFQKVLPWAHCDPEWAGECINSNTAKGNRSLTDLYFNNFVVGELDNIDDGIGLPDWRLSLGLLFTWILILASNFSGVKSAGKFAYFTALFPYVVLFILLGRGVSLPGASGGLKVLLTPDWERLFDPQIWYQAVTQCFFSLNTGFGTITMFSSYNKFNQNIYKDAVIISLVDTFTSFLAGITIFSVLGNLSQELGMSVSDLLKRVDGGGSLAFISYAEAIAKFTWCPQFFSVIFFLMLFALGLGSMSSDAGAVISVFTDGFPKVSKRIITVIVCVVGFFVGLPYVTPGGQWIFNLVDFYGASFIIFITAATEVTAIAWVYGVDNFILDIEFMLKIKLGWYWKLCWKYIIPPWLTIILIYSLYVDPDVKYNDKDYPTVATACGISLAVIAIMSLPTLAAYAMTKAAGSFKERFFGSLQPAEDWGPSDPAIRKEWLEFKAMRNKVDVTKPRSNNICWLALIGLAKLIIAVIWFKLKA